MFVLSVLLAIGGVCLVVLRDFHHHTHTPRTPSEPRLSLQAVPRHRGGQLGAYRPPASS